MNILFTLLSWLLGFLICLRRYWFWLLTVSAVVVALVWGVRLYSSALDLFAPAPGAPVRVEALAPTAAPESVAGGCQPPESKMCRDLVTGKSVWPEKYDFGTGPFGTRPKPSEPSPSQLQQAWDWVRGLPVIGEILQLAINIILFILVIFAAIFVLLVIMTMRSAATIFDAAFIVWEIIQTFITNRSIGQITGLLDRRGFFRPGQQPTPPQPQPSGGQPPTAATGAPVQGQPSRRRRRGQQRPQQTP